MAPFAEFHTHFIDKLALLNGFISGIALYPQFLKTLVDGESVGLSTPTFLIILINSIVWSIYAIHRRLIALLVASLLNTIASFGLVVLTFLA